MNAIINGIKRPIVIVLSVLAGFCLWVAGFHTPILSGLDILFYRGLALLGIVLALQCLFALVLPFRMVRENLLSILCLSSSLCLTFFVVFPVSIDRSVTIFLLREMAERKGHSFTEEDLSKLLRDKYVDELSAAHRRLHEQLYTGNVQQTGNAYQLSANGIEFLKFCDVVAALFNLRPPQPVESNLKADSP